MRFRRRQYLIDKQYQWKFIAGGMIYIAAIAVCLSLPFIPLFNSMDILLLDATVDVQEMVHGQQEWATATFVLCTVWLVAAWMLFAIFRSHKIAGPTFNIVQKMNKVTGGDLTARVILRSGDDLRKIEASMNTMLDSICDREETAQRRIREFLMREAREISPELIERAVAFGYPTPESVENPEDSDEVESASPEMEEITS